MHISQPGLVGRGAELEAIVGFLDREDGAPPILTLEGEAGIGKTTLWSAGIELARERGYRVLASRPANAEAALPFAALGDILAGCLDEAGVDLPPPQRRALEAALLLAEPGGTPPQPGTIAAAVLTCLRKLARAGPVLVAIDDAHWLDAPSAAAIEFALRRVGADEPIACLCSWRIEGGRHLTWGAEGQLRRVPVGELSLGALHRVIAAHLGHALPRPVLTRVHVISRGNPFFALELARVATDRGGRAEALALPDSLAGALRERLGTVPEATRDALLPVAALVTASLDLLEAALGPQAGTLLRPAIDAGLLVADGDRVRFAHPLTAAAVHAEAWPDRRRACHLALAELVEDPDDRVRHLALGSEGTDAALATALQAAARRARSRGAVESAASLIEQAWRATPPEERQRGWDRGVVAAEYLLQSGDRRRFRAVTEELLRAARTGDERSLMCVMLSLEIEGDETERGWLDRALDEAESPRQRQSVESDYVTVATVGGDLAEGVRHATESLRLAEQLDDPATLADAISSLARLEQLLGHGLRRDLLARIDALHELRQTERLEETVGLIRTTVASASLLATADEFDEARTRGVALHDLVGRQGLVESLPEVLRFRAELECLAGDWDLAEALAVEGDELAEQTGRNALRGDLLYPRAFVAAHRGRDGAARDLAAEGVRVAEAAGNHRNLLRHLAILGFMALSRDDPAGALVHLQRAAEIAAAAGFVEPNWLRFHDDLGEALIGGGRLEEAAVLLSWLEERAAESGYAWTHATAARCLGQLRAARNEHDAAVAALDQALAHGLGLGNPFELARTHLDLGRVHRRARRRVQARDHLTEALAGFEQVGAETWASTTRNELRRISGRRSGDPDGLTEAELRIAELVAAGGSNKEVAAALHLSVKTVEVTLTRVYRKLGVRSRSGLAAGFARDAKH